MTVISTRLRTNSDRYAPVISDSILQQHINAWAEMPWKNYFFFHARRTIYHHERGLGECSARPVGRPTPRPLPSPLQSPRIYIESLTHRGLLSWSFITVFCLGLVFSHYLFFFAVSSDSSTFLAEAASMCDNMFMNG